MSQLGEHYALKGILGAGGMATVYLATDLRDGSTWALKVLAKAFAHRALLRKRFLAEARTMARLDHEGIVAIREVGGEDDRPYIAMELVDGGTLIERIEHTGPVAPAIARDAIVAVLDALEHAHALGVVHRDIKPHNILTTPEGTPKLMDFGIARVVDESSSTRTGAMLGTPAYMAPEQHTSARQATTQSDIYSVGATLYHLVTGIRPLKLYAQSMTEIAEPLRGAILGATSFDPAGRYPTASAMRSALQALDLPPAPAGESLYIPRTELTALPGDLAEHATGPVPLLPNSDVSPPKSRPPSLLTGMLAIALVLGVLLLVERAIRVDGPAHTALRPPVPEVEAEEPEVEPALVSEEAEVEAEEPKVEPEEPTPDEPEADETEVEVQPKPPALAVVATGRVEVVGEVDALLLTSAAGSYPPGPLPVGVYAATATFGETRVQLPELTVAADGLVRLRCDAVFMRCVRE